jgi:glycosyltransferase involved in cell wall biosynthesis
MRVLCLDVDGAPFVSFEMASLVSRGHDVRFAGSRSIPALLKSGEFAALGDREVQLSRFGPAALGAALRFLIGKPGKTVTALVVAVVAYCREPGYLWKLLGSLGWTFAAARYAETEHVEHVHGNWAHLPATSAWMVSRLTGLPFSFSAHAGRDLYRTTALLDCKLAEARFAVVCNRTGVERLREFAPPRDRAKVHLHFHGVDLERFRPVARPPGGYVLSVGNLEPVKGLDVMIRAMGELHRSGRAVRYRIVGGGPERERLAALAAGLGVADRVELAGPMAGPDLVAAYQGAALLVMPSRVLANGGRDGLPNVIVEAMASGVPVVATAVGAIGEAVVDGETGLLVPPEDPAALAAAIARVLEDGTLAERLARAARRLVVDRFDRQRCVEGFCDLFGAPQAAERSRGATVGA